VINSWGAALLGCSRASARLRWLAIALVGLLSLAARALLLPILPIPKPAIQDEFSYLLASDTFASGRLTNPTHPLADRFETMQVLSYPTYASKYPPLPALVMALGQKMAGEPWIGVWLSMGVLCATLCWTLQGWLPPLWAFVGSLLPLLRIGIVSYWTESYWGGTCAAIGGALVIGALPRLIRKPRRGHAFVFTVGLVVLANSRPYEGLLLAAGCIVYFAFVAWRRRYRLRLSILGQHLLVSAALVFIPVALWIAYYNYRVTGNALQMPYLVHEKQYAVWTPWLWQTQPHAAPAYNNSQLRDFWLVADDAEKHYAHDHLLKAHVSDLIGLGRFFLGWPLILCIIAFARQLWRNPASRSVLLLCGAVYVGCALYTRLFAHYVAPATALFYLLAAFALRAAWKSGPGSPAERRYLTWSVMAIFALTTAIGLLRADNRFLFGPIDYHAQSKRASIEHRLLQEPGDHLVLVRYGPHHDIYEEFVYNRADIDRSRIVWARSLGAEKDSQLINYYRGRKVWLVEEDGEAKLSPYVTGTKGLLLVGSGDKPLGFLCPLLSSNPDLSYR